LLELGERRLLHLALRRRHHHVVLRVVAQGDDGGDLFAGLAVDDVDDGDALGLALGVGEVVGLREEDAAALGEEEDVVVRVADEEVADGVLLAGDHAGDAFAAAALQAVALEGHALDVAAVGDRDDGLLVGDEVLLGDVLGAGVDDLGAALVAVLLLELHHVVADQVVDLARALEEVLEVVDALDQLLELVLDLVAFEAGEAAELEVEDGLRLLVAHLPGLGHELLFGGVGGLGAADRLDDLVEVAQGDEVALEDVLAFAGAVELELGAAADDLAAVVDEGL